MKKPGLIVYFLLFVHFPLFASEASIVPPQTAWAALQEGNRRHVAGEPQPGFDAPALRAELARDGQKPLAAVVACSDSRVPVETLFQQPPGGLFVIRSAGNTAGVETLGSVQYGIEHLDIPLVVVLGHTRCGAVGAVASGEKAEGCLAMLLHPIRIAQHNQPCVRYPGEDPLSLLTATNVELARWTLRKNIPELDKRVAAGKTLLLGAVYDIESGEVSWLP